MLKKWRDIYRNSSLAEKIRTSYLLILIPMIVLVLLCLYGMWNINTQYGEMIDAASIASEFSLDFKKDFDYETYLLIVENKSIEESDLNRLLGEANRIVSGLEGIDTGSTNSARLKSVKKYLTNLDIYKKRIEENLRKGNFYEENIEIWENDVQIVTGLLRESMLQYIYYEIQEMRDSRTEYDRAYRNVIIGVMIAVAIITGIIIALSFYIPKSITKPIKNLSEVTNQVANGDLSVRADTDAGAEVGVLSDSLNAMIDKINALLEQVTTEQIHLRKAELELLQAQINPHFLYNTLDTIVWLAEAGDSKKVVEMVRSLSDFFRTALNEGKDMVTVKEELQHVSSYLRIQHVRYQDILEYEINVPEELNMYMIPKITVQPLVENALYHGIKNKRGRGMIRVTGEALDDGFVITVDDNGIGIDAERLARINDGMELAKPDEADIYGLYNVNERIRLKFGTAYGVNIDSVYGEGTKATVSLPYSLKEKNQP